jgi:hypothetical protein
VEGLATSETKAGTINSLKAIDVGALNALQTLARINQRKMMVINLNRLAPLKEMLRISSLKE